MPSWTRAEWEEEGRRALLDLLRTKIAVPWGEAVARISNAPWRDFRTVQPLQLEGSLHQLMREGLVLREVTTHRRPIVTYRLVDAPLSRDALERERGRRRKLYQKFVKWTGDPAACGHHAEKVLFASLKQGTGSGQYVVPNQRVGHVPTIDDVDVAPGPLDGLALLPNLDDWQSPPVVMVIEVKNVHDWIYSWDRRLWELLVKAAGLAEHMKVFPILACPHSDITAYRMGLDVGFSRARYDVQLFTPDPEKIPPEEFEQLLEEFDLTATRQDADAPIDPAVRFFSEEPRRRIRTSTGGRPWFAVAADRFQVVAPTILRFSSLAGDIEQPARGDVHRAFEIAARSVATWPWEGGWALADQPPED